MSLRFSMFMSLLATKSSVLIASTPFTTYDWMELTWASLVAAVELIPSHLDQPLNQPIFSCLRHKRA